MKKQSLTAFVFAFLVAGTAVAHADGSQIYMGVNGDVAFPSKSGVSGATTGSQKYSFSSGGDLSLGWEPDALKSPDMGDARFELQTGYHAFGLKSVRAGGVTNASPSGELKAVTGMANAFYDLHTPTPLTPYIGVGAGVAHVTIPTGNGLGNTNGGDTRFAYQGMVGVAYTAPSMPQASWTLGYRYLAVDAPSFSTATTNVKLSPVHESAIEAGLRYNF